MASEICNISLGRINELAERVNDNDPATSLFRFLLFVDAAKTDNDYRDADDVAAVEAITGATEVVDGSYARETATDADIGASTVDDTGDTRSFDVADTVTTWASLAGGDNITVMLCAYDSSGSDTDANMLAVAHYDFVVTSNGGDVVGQVNASGLWSAGQV